MIEVEALRLQVEYLETRIMETELRLKNAITYIEFLHNEKKEAISNTKLGNN